MVNGNEFDEARTINDWQLATRDMKYDHYLEVVRPFTEHETFERDNPREAL